MLGLNKQSDDQISNVQLLQLKVRLQGAAYIFLDEVSMLSCHDMYHISVRLARIFNETELPFGRLNMIFAGNFAQLPPAIGLLDKSTLPSIVEPLDNVPQVELIRNPQSGKCYGIKLCQL